MVALTKLDCILHPRLTGGREIDKYENGSKGHAESLS